MLLFFGFPNVTEDSEKKGEKPEPVETTLVSCYRLLARFLLDMPVGISVNQICQLEQRFFSCCLTALSNDS